jgi:hypothetical protein
MAKVTIKHNPRTRQVFDDLDAYLTFCKDYGYVFDEKDLYSTKSYVFRQFQKFVAGKPVKDNWSLDAKPRT